ncbi:alpha-N-arabinofuranosidase [Sphingomonas piscis]|uniref:non-reducing end alpha-L-arabinofuranosidase n=2 Tax=Sphingomonas piscis TaxID=2714943 RepID=A0A6G7YTI1_9SPHN|nr:alpha-N-arabinofuranosidase [Sphingomonas piscis]
MGGRIGAAATAMALILQPVAAAAQQAAPVRIDVQANRTGATIEPDIFGQFAEHLGTGIYGGVWVGKDSPIPNVRGIRTDVLQALKAIKVPNVRWPGGCFADEYHWREGIGPKRVERVNASWGGVIEPNTFGTHEFMDFVDQLGAETFLSVNVGSGTVQEAADWMEYLTTDKPTTLQKERAANGHPAPYKIKYLGLGNENWGCGGAMSNDHYVEEMKQFAHYSRNLNPDQNHAVPPVGGAQSHPNAMKRVAVGWDSGNSDYTESVMKAWKSKVWSWDIEGVSLHGYTIPNNWEKKGPSVGFGEDEYAKGIKATLAMKEWIAKQSAIMDRYDPEKKLGLYVDEWGIWVDPNPGSNPGFLQQQNTLRDAVIAALNLNIFARNADRVRGTNIAQMVNVLQAMILTDGPKMLLTPTYHVYHMYVPFQGAKVVPVSFEAGTYTHGGITLPRVDAIAARGTDGKLYLSLTNVDANKPARITAAVPGARRATGQVLTGPAVDTHNSFDNPNRIAPKPFSGRVSGGQLTFDLPAKSVAVVEVQ